MNMKITGLLTALVFLAAPSAQAAFGVETLSHKLSLDPGQIERVERIMKEEFDARRALRQGDRRPTCEERQAVWRATRDKMAGVLREDQLALYEERQQSRVRSCNRAEQYSGR